MKYLKVWFGVIVIFIFLSPLSNGVSGSQNTPWHLRHFPRAPRISAQDALKLYRSGQKVIVIDIPWSKEGFNKGHICGAVSTSVEAEKLDRLIKKIPKNYIILSYCK